MTQNVFNERLRQIIILAIIILIGCLLIAELNIFIPGALGALTLYIISRSLYLQLIHRKRWKPGLTALLFIISFLVIIAIPFYFAVNLVSPRVRDVIENKDEIIGKVQQLAESVQKSTGFKLLSEERMKSATQKISSYVPSILNSTTTVLSNLFIMFFLLYYLYIGGRSLEKTLRKIIPLKPSNIHLLASETKMMVRANALGIPFICVIQGIFAALGYWIFGVDNWGMWAFLTGIFAFFPIVGTMIVWVPLTIMLYSNGHVGAALGLGAFSIVVTGNVDYVARLGLMKKMGDVHPLITVMGVLLGLNLFGFIGLIFGPLLISYFLILVKIYINEFSNTFTEAELETETIAESKQGK